MWGEGEGKHFITYGYKVLYNSGNLKGKIYMQQDKQNNQ